MHDNFIIIPNDFVQSHKYSNETVFIYSILQKNLLLRKRQIIFNLEWLFNCLGIGKDNITSRKRIRKILKMLEDDKYINLYCEIDKINNNKLIFAIMSEIDEFFVRIFDYELDAISNFNYLNIDKYNLLCVFASIKSRIDCKDYCYPSFSTLMKNTGINSYTSITKYISILKNDLKLILYDNPGMIVVFDKNKEKMPIQSNNIYVMNYLGHDKILNQAIEDRKQNFIDENLKTFKTKNSNKKRSESMKKYWAKIKNNIN